MKRALSEKLMHWKHQAQRKPLILQGSRQVGKSYLLREFGTREFAALHVFNFEQDPRLQAVFASALNPQKILDDLSILSGKKIDAEHDCIFFDEIQECPRALTSLKYFCEEKPRLALLAAGSLLGVALAQSSFPVGKVEFLQLYPLTFEEFLWAQGDERALDIIAAVLRNHAPSPTVPTNTFFRYLRNIT